MVIATIALVTVTFIGIILTNKRTRESNELTRQSNELTRMELRARIRPVLEFSKTQASLQGCEPNYHTRLILTLKNSGVVPARKINAHYMETSNDAIEELVKEKDEIKSRNLPIGTIQNGGHHDFFIDIDWPKGKERTKLVIWLEYSYSDQKDEAVVVLDVTPGMEPVPHKWYVRDDIVEAEQQWKDTNLGKRGART